MKKILLASLIVMLTAILAACTDNGEEDEGDNQEQNQEEQGQEEQNNDEQSEDGENTGEESANGQESLTADLPEDEVVATVNGEEITNGELLQNETFVKQRYQMFGMQQSAEQIQQQALDQLINTELVLQSAEEAGIEPTEEEINTEYDNMISQLKEQNQTDDVSQIFEQAGTTEEEVRNDIRTQLTTEKYLDQNTEEVTVSDEEIQEAYDNYTAQLEQADQEPQSLEDMRGQLEQQVKTQKEGEQTQQLLDQLREDNDVEILI
ncbi:SurA N-terminal domain-containing protein [Tenuibacillus multivorans]|uniref:Peptidyl-prolyl cis-trans isomerase SurA n=1 Tax=Tenuibacillus multivorans TaxID=237069 RepID=A0A1H0B7C4_9BACI|nr:SurA N-terminal domain-containing protein [Tenuibacillus multivorans]GEL78613.1 hypothetical protein TMU01_28480 [Tenuibacillus multivorans]SDN41570.1 peptidyl-prolyl cis-trans isomerase SurA [Tenuibacillus multivorans]